MPKIPTPAEELANSKVNANARKAWEEALAQPDFENVGVIWVFSASTASDHRNGRCCDFMVTHTKTSLTRAQQVQLGNRIRAYFVKHARRLHVQGIIWNHQVTGYPVNHPHISNPDVDYRGPAGQARSYGGGDQHTDHNHIQVTGEAFKPLVPEKPFVWDGRSFPGAGAFHIGARGDYVTLLGQRLVAHGWNGYVEGPGPVFTDADRAGVEWFQEQQGWTGSDADGIPGEQTWQLLLADPAPATPKPTPKPQEPAVTKFRVATFNVLSDAAGKKGGEGGFASRLARITNTIRSSKASILLLQECNADRAAEIQDNLGPDWIWSRANARVVMVDETVWRMGTELVKTMPSPHSHTDKTWPLVELTHLDGGEAIWVGSLHFSSTSPYLKIATKAQMSAEREVQAEEVDKATRGLTVVVGGDHNSSSWSAGKPKAVLLKAGFHPLTKDRDFDSANVDSFPNKVPGGQQIDEIWCRGGGLEIVDGSIIRSAGGSDHNLLLADLTIAER